MPSAPRYVSAEEALRPVESSHRLFVHGSAMTPTVLMKALAEQKERLRGVELVFISVYGPMYVDQPGMEDHFHLNALFVSASIREAVDAGRADFVPVFLSEIPELFKRRVLPLDGAIVQVSPPDRSGYCSLGASVDVARSAVDSARYLIAQVNPQVPRTHGDGMIHYDRFAAMTWHEAPLHEAVFGGEIGPEEAKIGERVAGLVEDRSTLQIGIGAIPDAVLRSLGGHRDLGVHTEMFSDGLLDLCEKGVVTNRFKAIHPHKTVTGFALGSRRLYDAIDDNPGFAFLDIDYVNEPAIIGRNPRVVAINAAIEIDLTGQVCADSIGMRQYSGIGGQMDFMRGAVLSEGGKPILVLTSRTKGGIPRIVPTLRPGAGVVTTRGHVHTVVTEYGCAELFGRNLRERARSLIEIAHPDDRAALHRACFERFKIFA
ncbi:MAG: acetyl-CoA hydrolase/transferase C-terminal domain-containing protein [Myxococcota bacterium]